MSATLKTELLRILEELAPQCKNSPWMRRELNVLANREIPENDPKLIADLAELFAVVLSSENPTIFPDHAANASPSPSDSLKKFSIFCHNLVQVTPFIPTKQENETQMIDRIFNEEMMKHLNNHPKLSNRNR